MSCPPGVLWTEHLVFHVCILWIYYRSTGKMGRDIRVCAMPPPSGGGGHSRWGWVYKPILIADLADGLWFATAVKMSRHDLFLLPVSMNTDLPPKLCEGWQRSMSMVNRTFRVLWTHTLNLLQVYRPRWDMMLESVSPILPPPPPHTSITDGGWAFIIDCQIVKFTSTAGQDGTWCKSLCQPPPPPHTHTPQHTHK